MIDLGALRAKITLDDAEAINKLRGFGSETEKTTSRLKGFAKSTGTVAVGALTALGTAAVATGVAATKAFGNFEEGINKVTTIADTSVMSVNEIKSGILDLSNEMGIATGELSEAMYQAISATGDTANSLKYVENASKLAKGGFTDTSKALDAVTKTMNAYGESGEEAFSKVSDMLIQTQNLGITTVDELAGSLYNVVPTAAALGVEFEQVSAAMATMTSMGTPTSVATTQLRSAMQELSKSGTKASDTFKELSGQSFQEFISNGGTLSEAMGLMNEGAQSLNLNVTDLFSSVEAGAVALALTGSGAEKFNESLISMQSSTGATQEAYETMSKGINASFSKLMNAITNVLIQLGDKLAPVMVDIANWINEHMPQIQAVIEDTFNAIGIVIELVVKGFNNVMNVIKSFTEAAQTEGTAQNKIWTEVKDMFNDFFNSVKEFVTSFVQVFQKLWEQFGSTITKYTEWLLGAVGIIFETTFKTITNLLNVFSNIFQGDWAGLWKSVKQLVTDILDGICEFIQNSFSSIISIAQDIIPRMKQAGIDMFQGLWDGIKSIWDNISNWVQDKVSWMVDKLMFWRDSANEMSYSGSVNGSHANGINYVPYDGYKAELHKGERVLTAEQSRNYSEMSTSGIEEKLDRICNKLDRLPRNMAIESRF